MARSRGDENTAKELRARLEALNRKFANGRKPAVVSADDLRPPASATPPRQKQQKPEPIVYCRDLPRVETPAAAAPGNAEVILEDAVEGEVWEHSRFGRAYVVRTATDTLDGTAGVSSSFRRVLHDPPPGLAHHVNQVTPVAELDVDDVLFMDIETTGLNNTPVFLIGIMIWRHGGFEVQQYLARNYAEEKAILAFFVDECAERKLLVTFNGKSFDFPFLRTRSAANGVPYGLAPLHLDLLHVGRRIWKGQFENCKLQTLEAQVCGRVRHGDIPGALIPDAYHRFVRSRNAWQMVDVLRHNLLDLVTMADIMTRFPPPKPPKKTKRKRRKPQ